LWEVFATRIDVVCNEILAHGAQRVQDQGLQQSVPA
jgi:hypothetical protein